MTLPSVEPPVPEARASRPVLTPPGGVETTAYWLGLTGALSLGLAVGIQLLLNVLMLLGPVQITPAMAAKWTAHGQVLIRPEREMPIFVAGSVIILGLMLAFAALWIRRLRRTAHEERRRFAWTAAIHQTFLAVGGLALYFTLLWNRFPALPVDPRGPMRVAIGRYATALLFLPAVLSIACALADLSPRFRRQSAHRSRTIVAARIVLELALPALLVLSVFIPPGRWKPLAGWFLVSEALHHWSYYAMAPALSFAHGKAFFTDFYSQYGFGWPLLYAAFHSRPLTYSSLIGMGIVYSCVYVLGFYLLARLLFRDVVWAGIAALLAVMLRMYPWLAYETLWRFPSLTVIRHPADVWFLAALVLHERRGGRAWLMLAGAMCGAGLCFGTDTGIYLLVTLGIYGLFVALRSGIRRAGATLGLALGAAFAVLFAFGWVANRGRFPGPTFWYGWLEPIRAYGVGGLGMNPMASVDEVGIELFVVFLIVYFIAIAIKGIHVLNRRESAQRTLLALVACYGMVSLLSFIGKSGTGILYTVSVPFAIVVVGLLQQLRDAVRTRLAFTAVPAGMLITAAVMLLTRQEFTAVPTLLSSRPRVVEILTRDLEIPEGTGASRATIELMGKWMRMVPATIRKYSRNGNDVAVLDPWDTVFYAAADVCPWPRYPDSIYSMVTRDMLQRAQADLLKRRPQYVLLRDTSNFYPTAHDVWAAYQQTLQDGPYERVMGVAGFGVWRYNKQATSTRPAAAATRVAPQTRP